MAKSCETIKFTKRTIDAALPQGGGKQRLYFDSELRGFGLCVGARTKTYFAQGTVRGRFQRITIGRHGVFTVDEARREAQQVLAKIARGDNPIEDKRKAAIRGFTLAQALELCEQTLKTKGRSDKTIHGYKYAIETYLKDWLARPLSEISRDDVHRRHLKIAADVASGRYANGRPRHEGHGKVTADSVLIAFRAVYNRALRGHPELPANPCINVDFFRVKREKKELPLSQLHHWFKHVAQIENAIRRDYLIFALYTGQRRTSAAEARWEHVDFAQRVLTIPKPKGGRSFALPLTGFLLELLSARQKANAELFEDSPWVFPALSASGHIAAPHEEFEGVAWTLHDTRRWFISTASELNLHPWDIKLLVNHRLPSGDVTAGYVKHEVDRLRPAMEAISAKLRMLCIPPSQANVLPLSSQRKAA